MPAQNSTHGTWYVFLVILFLECFYCCSVFLGRVISLFVFGQIADFFFCFVWFVFGKTS